MAFALLSSKSLVYPKYLDSKVTPPEIYCVYKSKFRDLDL